MFFTGNPVPSTDPKDLFDNAQAFDEGMNSPNLTFIGRLGQTLQSWAGAVGYQLLGDYVDGAVGQFTITNYNQVFRRGGEFWRAAASTGLPYTTTGDWGTEGSKFVSVGDAVLRNALAADTGATLLGYKAPWTGAQGITQAAKNAQTVHLSEFPSSPANTWLSRAIAGTPAGMTLQLPPGNVRGNIRVTKDNVRIVGSGMGRYNAGKTAIVGGTVIQGTLAITGQNPYVSDLGVDCGSDVCTAFNSGNPMDCLVFNDPARADMFNCGAANILTLCQNPTAAVHNFLFEGCVDSQFSNLHGRYGQWGVVMKTRRSYLFGATAYACSKAGFTFKSDSGVAGTPCIDSHAFGVQTYADDYAAAETGILSYSATSSMVGCTVNGFTCDGGVEGLKIVCDSRAANVNLTSDCSFNGGTIRGQTTKGITSIGAVRSVRVTNTVVRDVASNLAIEIDNQNLGFDLIGVDAKVSAVLANNINIAGRFTLDDVKCTVSGDYATRGGINLTPDGQVYMVIGSVKARTFFSGVEATITLSNGWTANTPIGLRVNEGRVILSGRLAVPATPWTGKEVFGQMSTVSLAPIATTLYPAFANGASEMKSTQLQITSTGAMSLPTLNTSSAFPTTTTTVILDGLSFPLAA